MVKDVKFGEFKLKLRIILRSAVLELRSDGRTAAIPIHSLLLVSLHLIPVKLLRTFLNVGVGFRLWHQSLLPIDYRGSGWLRRHRLLIVHDRPSLNRILIVLAIDALAVT